MDTISTILEKAQAGGNYKKLVKQLNKDINRAGLAHAFDLGEKPNVISRNLVAQIYALIITDFEAYLNLLYLIDIPESTIKKLDVTQVDQLASAVSLLIIKRELYKITFKSAT